MRRTGHACRGKVVAVKAGQNGHGHDLGVFAGGGLGIFHHGPATCRMDGDDGWLQHVNGLHRCSNGIGNVMQFEIEKDRHADMGDLVHTVVAMRTEEFETEFQAANMALYLAGKVKGSVEAGQVKRKVNRIHGFPSVFWDLYSASASSSLVEDSDSDAA